MDLQVTDSMLEELEKDEQEDREQYSCVSSESADSEEEQSLTDLKKNGYQESFGANFEEEKSSWIDLAALSPDGTLKYEAMIQAAKQ